MADTPATPAESTPVWDMAEGQLRAILGPVGALLAGNGWLTASQWQLWSGVIMAIAPLVWSAYSHWRIAQKNKAQVGNALNTGIIISDATPGKTAQIAPEHAEAAIKAVAAAVTASPTAVALPSPAALASAAAASPVVIPVEKETAP